MLLPPLLFSLLRWPLRRAATVAMVIIATNTAIIATQPRDREYREDRDYQDYRDYRDREQYEYYRQPEPRCHRDEYQGRDGRWYTRNICD